MSATIDAIRTWSARTGGVYTEPQGRPASFYDERTPQRPLREITQEQAARLRAIHEPVAPRTRREQRAAAVKERVAAVVAAAPVAVERPAAQGTVVDTRETKRERFVRLDAMAAATPDGRYALPRRVEAGEGQSMYFFQITGKRIVMLTGGVGAFAKHPMSTTYQEVALTKIAADPRAAAVRFGHATSVCGRCGSPLTNDASVARGLGPDCAKAF